MRVAKKDDGYELGRGKGYSKSKAVLWGTEIQSKEN